MKRQKVGSYGGTYSSKSANKTVGGISKLLARRRMARGSSGAPLAPRGFRGNYAAFSSRSQAPERKVRDVAAAVYACDTTGSVTLVNGIAQGTDYTNRIGRRYMNVAVQLEGILSAVLTTAGSSKARVMLVYDASPNSGSTPAITDILTASTSSAFMNLNNRDRFRVLCDENHVIAQITIGTGVSYGQNCKNISVFKSISLPTVNSGTGATLGSIESGAIYLVTIGDIATVGAITFNGAVRVRFTDN